MKYPVSTLNCFLFVTALAVVSASSLNGAVDMFLKIEGVDGESQDGAHTGEIDVLAWSWGMSNDGTTHAGGGAGAGKVSMQDFHMTKFQDKATANLLLKCANGEHIPEAILTCRKAGGAGGPGGPPLEYLIIKMTNILVSSVSTGGSAGEDRLTENVTFNFSKVEVMYTEQRPDGSIGDTVEMSWDIVTNTP